MVKVDVYIPHYFREEGEESGYGSARPGARLQRSIALSRCLSGLINLERRRQDCTINISRKSIDLFPAKSEDEIQIRITVCTDGHNRIDEVLQHYRETVRVIDIQLENPRLLALRTRDQLINRPSDADFFIYMEDDLVINDPLYIDKIVWFYQRTNHGICLMPHRYELINSRELGRTLIDGDLRDSFIRQYYQPAVNAAQGQFRGTEPVQFDIPSNPHSGSFILSRSQATALGSQSLPEEGFIGPLETAATLTVMQYYPVMKTSYPCRGFFAVEHGHPSFRHYTKVFPRTNWSSQSDQSG